jgi:hypothetical protein
MIPMELGRAGLLEQCPSMPLPRLVPENDQVALQETRFSPDALGRFVSHKQRNL